MIGNDVVGRGIKENMRMIKKRDVRLRRTDAMGDRWVREQQTWNEPEREENGS